MNEWIRRSIELAKQRDYLDRLSQIYAIPHELRRPIDRETRHQILKLFESRDAVGLIRLLMGLKKFPFQDPYIGSLRVDEGAITRNPQTVERIARILYTMGPDKIIEGLEEPPQPNRQLGALFKRWLRTSQYPFFSEEDFVGADGISFLRGSNGKLKEFADRILRCQLEKRPDFVAKTPRGYIVGEAKFITTGGGNQDKSFREVVRFLHEEKGEAIRVGLLDGVVWLTDTGLYATIREVEHPAMTALLLNDFLQAPP